MIRGGSTSVRSWGLSTSCVLALALLLVENPAHTHQDTRSHVDHDLGAALRQVRYDLRLSNGLLEGTAAAWLIAEASKVRFLFIGEEHDTREIPAILAALWPSLAANGYGHVAIEAGPWLGGRLDRLARLGDRVALDQFKGAALPRRPNVSVPPSSDEDIAFYEQLGRSARREAAGRTSLIWGLDHEFKSAPLLRRLVALAPAGTWRARLAALLNDVAKAEAAGQYDLRPFTPTVQRVLVEAPAGTSDDGERAQLLDALRRRVAGDSGEQVRGEVFRQLFVQNYRAAQAVGETEPRVLLRFGAYHAKRGLMSEFGTSTLANFVAEFGHLESASMLNVMFVACSPTSTDDWRAPRFHPRPCSPRERAWLAPFAGTAVAPWTLYDLRPLRRPLANATLAAGWELREVVMGFDAVIVVTDSVRARFPGAPPIGE